MTKEAVKSRPRISAEIKDEARRLKNEGWRNIDIAKNLGLGPSTIAMILGKTTFPKTLTVNSKTLTIAEWANINGLTVTAIRCRLKRGCTPAEAVAPGAYKTGVKTRTLKEGNNA